MSNPIKMLGYMIKTLWEKIFPSDDNDIAIDDNTDSDKESGGLSLTTTFIILGVVFCLMNFFVIYCAIQYFRYQKGNKKSKKSPKVSSGLLSVDQIQTHLHKLSGKSGSLKDEGDNLLSASSIQSKITELKNQPRDFDDEMMVFRPDGMQHSNFIATLN